MLRDLGCTTGQGYLFGRAMDLPAALALVSGEPFPMHGKGDRTHPFPVARAGSA